MLYFLPEKVFTIKVMLTFAFFAALAIYIRKSRLQWAVGIWAGQSFTLDGSILRRKQYLGIFKLHFGSFQLFLYLFLKFQTLPIKLNKYYDSLWLLYSKTHNTETHSGINWVITHLVIRSHLLSTTDPN